MSEQTAVGAASRARSEVLRANILDYLKTHIGGEGKHATISTKALASRFSVTPVTVSKHLHALARAGYIHTKPAGPKGTIITMEREPRGRLRLAPPERAVVRAGARPGSPTGTFCPWCGSKAQRAWRYCNRCGHSLPH